MIGLLSIMESDEQADFVIEAVESALEEAKEVLARHEKEEPPLFDVQTIGEAAEDYMNLVATQQRRVAALEHFLKHMRG